jgi:hypothetical protein
MNRKLNLLLTFIVLTIIAGCCSMPGQSGTDCTKYAQSKRLALELNFDSTQNGFKLHEADSTYIIIFNSLGFKQPSDTIWLDRFAFIQQNGKSLYEFGGILNNSATDYLYSSSYIIKNRYSNDQLRIDSVVMQIIKNDSKCCSDYSRQLPKSFYVNGNKIDRQSSIKLNKN